MRPTCRMLLAVSALAVLGLLQLPDSRAAASLCKAPEKLSLNVGAAAAVPIFKGNTKSTIGVAGARALAASISAGGGNICSSPASAAVKRSLAQIDRLAQNGDQAEARRLLRAALAKVKRQRRQQALPGARLVDSVLLAACPDQMGFLSLATVKGVGDNLALAAKAQQLGDPALAAQAMTAARAALKAWVQTPANRATTVGDWLAIVKAAEQIDAVQVGTYALGRARNQAIADVAEAAQVDPCTVNRGDFNCWVRMIATAQLVGAPVVNELKTAQEFGKAIEDRIKNRLPQGCEEWTFTMTKITKMANNRTDWTIRWGAGKFRVNRKLGVLDGTFRAGYIPEGGWPGVIGSATDDCILTSEEGSINYGPGTINSVAFRYKIDGTVTESVIDLSVSSQDAKVSMSAPSDPFCQLAAAITTSVSEAIFRAGWPVVFSVTADQEVATYEFSDEDGSETAEIKRTPIVKP